MDELIAVGRIGPPRGVRGDVFVEPFTDEPDERFAPGTVLTARAPRRRPHDGPAPAREVATFLASELGVDTEAFRGHEGAAHPSATRRLSNARLRETGFILTYPTFREGYASILAGEGERHP